MDYDGLVRYGSVWIRGILWHCHNGPIWSRWANYGQWLLDGFGLTDFNQARNSSAEWDAQTPDDPDRLRSSSFGVQTTVLATSRPACPCGTEWNRLTKIPKVFRWVQNRIQRNSSIIHIDLFLSLYIYESGLRIPGPPPWYGPPSSRSREHGTRDHTYMHACMHPSIHPDASIHPSIHTYLHTYIPTYLRTYVPPYTRTHVHTYIHTYIHTYPPTYLRTYVPTCLRTYVPTYTRTHVHTYIPTYLHTYIDT